MWQNIVSWESGFWQWVQTTTKPIIGDSKTPDGRVLLVTFDLAGCERHACSCLPCLVPLSSPCQGLRLARTAGRDIKGMPVARGYPCGKSSLHYSWLGQSPPPLSPSYPRRRRVAQTTGVTPTRQSATAVKDNSWTSTRNGQPQKSLRLFSLVSFTSPHPGRWTPSGEPPGAFTDCPWYPPIPVLPMDDGVLSNLFVPRATLFTPPLLLRPEWWKIMKDDSFHWLCRAWCLPI